MMIVASDAAAEGGDQPEERAQGNGDDDHREADEERQPRPVDQARKHVAADLVGAEQEARVAALLPDRRNADEIAKLLDRRVGRDEVGENRGEEKEG